MDTLQLDEPHDGVTRITLNRPERLNAINAALIADLHEALFSVSDGPGLPGRRDHRRRGGFFAGLDLAGHGRAPGAEPPDQVVRPCRADRYRRTGPPSPWLPPAGDRRRQRASGRRRLRPRPRHRHPHRSRLGPLQRRLRPPWVSGCDMGCAVFCPGCRRLTGMGTDAHRPPLDADKPASSVSSSGGGRRGAAGRRAPDRRTDRGQRPLGSGMTKEVMWPQLERASSSRASTSRTAPRCCRP